MAPGPFETPLASSPRTNRLAGALAWVVVVAIVALGLVIGLQGWKNSLFSIDMIPDIENAIDLVQVGRLPAKGNLSSFSSYNPPGPSWLYAPGVLCFDDPRLFHVPGVILVYGAAVVGVFLLGREMFGVPCGVLAAVLYGLSTIGLTVANWPWQRLPMQAFAVWTVYGACRWVGRRDPRFLALALVACAAGMYVFMEMAPVLLVLPVLWVLFRPPISLRALLVAGAAALLIWFPYLRFESARGFADLRSLLGRVNLVRSDFKSAWCDPGLHVRLLGKKSSTGPRPPAPPPPTGGLRGLYRRLEPVLEWGTSRVDNALQGLDPSPRFSAAPVLTLLITLAGLLLFGVRPSNVGPVPGTGRGDRLPRRRVFLSLLAGGMIVLALAANEFLVARFLSPRGALSRDQMFVVRTSQVILLLAAAAIALRRRLYRLVRLLAERTPDPRPLVVSLLILWLALLAIAEPNRGDRFWWLWPFQAVMAAAVVTVIPAWRGAPGWVRWIAGALLIPICFGHAPVRDHWNSWQEHGWSGPDADAWQAVDDVATRIHARGKDRAAIGYQLILTGGEAVQYYIDPRYKAGVEMDFLLRWRHGITNEDRCAEGASPSDDYRIVDVRTEQEDFAVDDPLAEFRCIRFSLPAHLEPVRLYGSYQVFQRR